MKSFRLIGTIWGVIGIVYIIGWAIYRVLPHAIDAFKVNLSPLQYFILILWCIFMIVSEGYRGFQKKFSPRVSARALHLANHGSKLDLILAPFFCVGYYGASRKRIITSWIATFGIVALIILVIQLPQPWRGIADWGVVLGLFYGLITLFISLYRTFDEHKYLTNPDIINFKKPSN